MKKISVIIVTYNSLDDIVNCIHSIYNQNDLLIEEIEIVVVDNSTLEIYNQMNKLISDNFHNIKVIHNPSNGGYGQGNNVGIREANSEIVCVANPDIILQQPMFKKVIKLFQDNKKLALVGGKQLGGINLSFWIRPEYEFFIFTTPLMSLLNRLNVYFEKFFFLSGALLFIDKTKFEKIGLFDENFFLYREESDITKRFLINNFTTHFEKSFVYKHLVDDRTNISLSSFEEEMKSTKYYLEKFNYSFPKFLFQRVYSYNILKCLFLLVGNKKFYNKTMQYLGRFKNIKNKKL
ncbi:glycosyltransferase [Chryseobacterium daecheongense]|uniref:glycosyltransferase n=1 Tax=Chryseobacterium daecheongense TaxID=192389 RepID=UPI001FD64354|nr:glycosyltransferase [Chryseobacterium daecheongense]UOU96722.1 glycosyltransferase [Chryseobacterium daecheongense]